MKCEGNYAHPQPKSGLWDINLAFLSNWIESIQLSCRSFPHKKERHFPSQPSIQQSIQSLSIVHCLRTQNNIKSQYPLNKNKPETKQTYA